MNPVEDDDIIKLVKQIEQNVSLRVNITDIPSEQRVDNVSNNDAGGNTK